MSDTATPETAPASAETTAAPAEAATPATEAKPTSGELLTLAKKEAEWAKKEVARKEEMAKLRNDYEATQKELEGYKKIREDYRKNPEEVLGRIGLTYQELTDAVIEYYDNKDKAPEPVDINKVREEVIAELKKQEAAKIESEHAAAIQTFQKEIDSFVAETRNQYPHINNLYKQFAEADTPQQLIFEAIENHFNATNEILDFKTVADVAEQYFRDQWNTLQGTLSGKIQEPAPAAPSKPPVTTSEEQPVKALSASAFKVKERQTPSTITNNMAHPKIRVPYDPKREQRKDAITRAVEAMENSSRKSK